MRGGKARKRRQAKQEQAPPGKFLRDAFIPNFSGSKWLMLAILVATGLFLTYFITRPIPPPIVVSYADPLVPLTGLKMVSGENYVYSWSDPQLGEVRIENKVGNLAGECLLVTTESNNATIPFCLDGKTGEPIDPSRQGQTLNVSPQFFQSWMLALTDGWTWRASVNTTVEWLGSSETIESASNYRVAARGTVKGREAFKVLIETSMARISNEKRYPSETATQVVWVDAEKRVLLYAGSEEGHLELMEAPFKVEPYSEPK